MIKNYCIAHHDADTCFLPHCRYHIFFLCNFEELLQELDQWCFAYKHVDCLFTLFMYRFTRDNVVRNGQVFDKVQRGVCFNGSNKGVHRMPSIAKKKVSKKNYRKQLLSPVQKTKSMQSNRRVSAERIEQEKKAKFGVELSKPVENFSDGYGGNSTISVNFEINF